MLALLFHIKVIISSVAGLHMVSYMADLFMYSSMVDRDRVGVSVHFYTFHGFYALDQAPFDMFRRPNKHRHPSADYIGLS